MRIVSILSHPCFIWIKRQHGRCLVERPLESASHGEVGSDVNSEDSKTDFWGYGAARGGRLFCKQNISGIRFPGTPPRPHTKRSLEIDNVVECRSLVCSRIAL